MSTPSLIRGKLMVGKATTLCRACDSDHRLLDSSNGGRAGLERCQATARKHVRLYGHTVVVKTERSVVYEPRV